MTGNVNRYKRKKSPGRLILQTRDREIIVVVYSFRIMTREQIQSLFGLNSTRRANSRLRKLFDHRYLSRMFLPTTKGSPKALYFLGPEGVTMAAQELGIDPLEVKRKVKQISRLKELFLNHRLQIIDARIAFSGAVQNQPEMRMQTWIMEDELQQEYRVMERGNNRARRLRPDGYFRIWHQEKLNSFFLELDRSTMSHARFKKKVETYLEFSRLGYYEARFGMKYFRVLVITLTPARLFNLKKVVESVTDRFFWFTTLDQVTTGNALDPVWHRVGYKGTYSLFQPVHN